MTDPFVSLNLEAEQQRVLRLSLCVCVQAWLCKLTVDYSEDQRSQKIALSAISNAFGVGLATSFHNCTCQKISFAHSCKNRKLAKLFPASTSGYTAGYILNNINLYQDLLLKLSHCSAGMHVEVEGLAQPSRGATTPMDAESPNNLPPSRTQDILNESHFVYIY